MPGTGPSCLETEVELTAREEGKVKRAVKNAVCCSWCWGKRRGQESCCWERPPPPHTPSSSSCRRDGSAETWHVLSGQQSQGLHQLRGNCFAQNYNLPWCNSEFTQDAWGCCGTHPALGFSSHQQRATARIKYWEVPTSPFAHSHTGSHLVFGHHGLR